MEGSLADSEFGGGGGRSSIVKRKSSRSNSIVFKTVPEISHFIESSEDDSSADGSLALDELDETHRTPQPIIPSRSSSSIASPSQRRNVSDTQKTTVFSAVSRFAKHMSSLGFQSTSEEVSPNSNRRMSSASVRMRDRTIVTNTNRRSSGLSARTASASVVSRGEQPTETYCLSDGKINALRSLINHRVWTWTTGFFVVVMLFGAPIQDLFLPASADVTVDVVFTLAFITLLVDILIRCIVDKAYFAWDRVGTSLTPQANCKWFNMHAASFMFWCDIVGTLTFIYDLSYINVMMAIPMSIGLEVKDGISVRQLRVLQIPAFCTFSNFTQRSMCRSGEEIFSPTLIFLPIFISIGRSLS